MAKCKNCRNLYNLSDENDVIIGKWCPKINDSPHTDIDRECKFYNCMTQAERIRSMNDEELADFITELNQCCLAATGVVDCSDKSCTDCRKIVNKWLQSNVKESE